MATWSKENSGQHQLLRLTQLITIQFRRESNSLNLDHMNQLLLYVDPLVEGIYQTGIIILFDLVLNVQMLLCIFLRGEGM